VSGSSRQKGGQRCILILSAVAVNTASFLLFEAPRSGGPSGKRRPSYAHGSSQALSLPPRVGAPCPCGTTTGWSGPVVGGLWISWGTFGEFLAAELGPLTSHLGARDGGECSKCRRHFTFSLSLWQAQADAPALDRFVLAYPRRELHTVRRWVPSKVPKWSPFKSALLQ
jgi:hypothetical protein